MILRIDGESFVSCIPRDTHLISTEQPFFLLRLSFLVSNSDVVGIRDRDTFTQYFGIFLRANISPDAGESNSRKRTILLVCFDGPSVILNPIASRHCGK